MSIFSTYGSEGRDIQSFHSEDSNSLLQENRACKDYRATLPAMIIAMIIMTTHWPKFKPCIRNMFFDISDARMNHVFLNHQIL